MTSSDALGRHSLQGEVDFTMMYAAHDAFRRDLRRLNAVAGVVPGGSPSVLAGWETFKNQLHIHHTVEDIALWPPLRERIAQPAEIDILDSMEAEHARIDPLLSRVDAALTAADGAELAGNANELATALKAHMEHEEKEALPLVEAHLGPEGWAGFMTAIRKRQGLKGAAEFVPWVLDDAPTETSVRVLGVLPPPARLIYQTVWRPRYARVPRWNITTA